MIVFIAHNILKFMTAVNLVLKTFEDVESVWNFKILFVFLPFSFQLMAKLQEVECVNINLKSYVDKIILTILEKNPSILEITNR